MLCQYPNNKNNNTDHNRHHAQLTSDTRQLTLEWRLFAIALMDHRRDLADLGLHTCLCHDCTSPSLGHDRSPKDTVMLITQLLCISILDRLGDWHALTSQCCFLDL